MVPHLKLSVGLKVFLFFFLLELAQNFVDIEQKHQQFSLYRFNLFAKSKASSILPLSLGAACNILYVSTIRREQLE